MVPTWINLDACRCTYVAYAWASNHAEFCARLPSLPTRRSQRCVENSRPYEANLPQATWQGIDPRSWYVCPARRIKETGWVWMGYHLHAMENYKDFGGTMFMDAERFIFGSVFWFSTSGIAKEWNGPGTVLPRQHWGNAPIPKGVVKLGFSWEALDVKFWEGQSGVFATWECWMDDGDYAKKCTETCVVENVLKTFELHVYAARAWPCILDRFRLITWWHGISIWICNSYIYTFPANWWFACNKWSPSCHWHAPHATSLIIWTAHLVDPVCVAGQRGLETAISQLTQVGRVRIQW